MKKATAGDKRHSPCSLFLADIHQYVEYLPGQFPLEGRPGFRGQHRVPQARDQRAKFVLPVP